MQPTTKVAWIIVNDVIDLLYDNAKEKEATYNKHVKVHKNVLHVKQAPKVKSITRQKGARLSILDLIDAYADADADSDVNADNSPLGSASGMNESSMRSSS